ncbi:MAG: hypothetical protein CM15mP83_2460 [Flavobacteriaceae bacterium]|nr:MAG: hypothetical protein CM15mP83_2460 [Flavobacteriaceae bacterium]
MGNQPQHGVHDKTTKTPKILIGSVAENTMGKPINKEFSPEGWRARRRGKTPKFFL